MEKPRVKVCIGVATPRAPPVYTDEPRVVRRIAYAVWRYFTRAGAEEVRYVEGWRYRDWSWYSHPYATASWAVCHAIRDFREDLYVPTLLHNGMTWSSVHDRYSQQHGVNVTTAAMSVLYELDRLGCLERLPKDGPSEWWKVNVEELDAWVASCLLQMEPG